MIGAGAAIGSTCCPQVIAMAFMVCMKYWIQCDVSYLGVRCDCRRTVSL